MPIKYYAVQVLLDEAMDAEERKINELNARAEADFYRDLGTKASMLEDHEVDELYDYLFNE